METGSRDPVWVAGRSPAEAARRGRFLPVTGVRHPGRTRSRSNPPRPKATAERASRSPRGASSARGGELGLRDIPRDENPSVAGIHHNSVRTTKLR
jgi:hypothetical protein